MVFNRIGRTVFVTVDRDASASILRDLAHSIATEVHDHHDEQVVLDLAAVEILDSTDAEELARAARVIRMLGAGVIFAGLRPEVVMALVISGVDLGAVDCALDVGRAAALANSRKDTPR